MKVHHLNCGTMNMPSARLLASRGGLAAIGLVGKRIVNGEDDVQLPDYSHVGIASQ
jgi:hypothetical protein